MDFALTPEQQRLSREVARFARDELSGGAAHNDQNSVFDRAAWQRCADFGILGWTVPTEYGGAGLGPLDWAVAYEALGFGCRDNGLVFVVNNHVWACVAYLLAHGDAAQRARFLPGLADGSLIGAHALTEPDAGSDVLSLTTTAVRRPDGGYMLNGVKTFISNAPVADLFVLFARTAEERSQRSLTAFLVPAGTPGVEVARSWRKAGLRGTPMGEIRLCDAVLLPELRLGAQGAGYQVFTSTIEQERGFMFASQVGVLRRLFEDASRYAAGRQQFGAAIDTQQAVSHKLAEIRIRLEAARLMLYKFAWLKQAGRLALLESSMLKLQVSESLVAAGLASMQIHGARGYLEEFGVEREVRDALATTIYGGTSEIHRSIIAELSGGFGG